MFELAASPYPYSNFIHSLSITYSDVSYSGQRTHDKYSRFGLNNLGYVGMEHLQQPGTDSLSLLPDNKVQDFTMRTCSPDTESNWFTPVATMTDGIVQQP